LLLKFLTLREENVQEVPKIMLRQAGKCAKRLLKALLTELKTHSGYAQRVLDNFLATLRMGNAKIILTTSWEHFPWCFEMFPLTTPR
jgi:hypothetical protein